MGVSVITHSNAPEIFKYFGTVASRAVPQAQESANAAGELLKEGIQRRISVHGDGIPSAPGEAPRYQKGDYYDSWHVEPVHGPAEVGVLVYTDDPAGRRLEWGFDGMTDSLGRLFHQKPRPHVGPEVDQIAPVLFDDLLDKIVRA